MAKRKDLEDELDCDSPPDKTLDEYCAKYDFSRELNGNVYCQLGMEERAKSIQCKFISKFPDHNGLYPCRNMKYGTFYEENTTLN